MNKPVIIEEHNEVGVIWFLSFGGSNPSNMNDYIQLPKHVCEWLLQKWEETHGVNALNAQQGNPTSKLTREEAVEYFKELEQEWLNPTDEYIAQMSTREEIIEHGKYFSEALSTLSPEPRTEPPTVDEVGDETECWLYLEGMVWECFMGRHARMKWDHEPLAIAWLPYSALPMPKGGA